MNWRSVTWSALEFPAGNRLNHPLLVRRNGRPQGDSRLALPFLLAIFLHGAVIWGVGFSPGKPRPAGPETMEIIFVQEESAGKPQKADYLAQTNLEGASDRHADKNPAAPLPPPLPDRRAQIAMLPEPDTRQEATQNDVTEATSAINVAQAQLPPGQTDEAGGDVAPVMAVPNERAPHHQRPANLDEKSIPVKAAISRAEASDPQPVADAARLISNSFAMASLSAEIDQRLESRSKRLRQKFVSASTQEYKFAAYMESWRAKVERIGNLNYPEEARRQHLSGNLLLDVAINPDGTIADIVIRRPSGHKDLDAAAVHIVQLAAPFAPFPEEIRRETDVLHITRSWQFMHNFQFASKR